MSEGKARSEAADASKAILALLDIERVICVDDEYSRQHGDELIAACGDPRDETVKKMRDFGFLREESIPEDRRLLARDYLTNLDPVQQEHLYRTWRAQREDFADDLQYAVLLSDVLTGTNFKGVSLADWRSKQTEYLNISAGKKIAVIFDLDMRREAGGREDEGVHLLKDLLASPQCDNVLCGILSHHVKPGEEYEKWLGFSDKYGVNRERFVVMSKCESTSDPNHVPRALKLVALTPGCRQLAEAAATALKGATDGALKWISELNPYVFENIVFRASADEGAWEVDTLFRLYNVYHRKAALDSARTDGNLQVAAAKLRRLSTIAAMLPHPLQATSREILMWERFDESDVVNALNLPPDVGDIYQITRSGVEPLLMVLLNQPCDTAIRSSGERRSELKLAALASMEMDADPRDSPALHEMLYYSKVPNEHWYVSFNGVLQIPFWMLDVCTYSTDGAASVDFTVEDCPAVVSEGWKLRYKAVLAEAQEFASAIRALLPTGADQTSPEIVTLMDKLGLPAMDVTLPTTGANRLVLGLRRLRRYCRPWSLAMLQSYAAHLSRPALPHDLGTPPRE